MREPGARGVELVRDAQGRLYDADSGAFRGDDDVLAALDTRLPLRVLDEQGADVTREVVARAQASGPEPATPGRLGGLLDVAGGLLAEAAGRPGPPQPARADEVDPAPDDRPARLPRARPRGAVTVVSGTRNGLQQYRCECLVHASSAALWDVVSDLRLILETSPGLRSYVLAGDPPRSATGELLFGWGPVERLLPITFALTVVTEQERLEVHVGAGNDAVRLHGVFDLEHLSRRTCNLTYQVSVEVTASAGMTAQLMKRSAQDVAEEHANRVVDRVVTLAEAAQLADDVLGGDRQE